MYDWGLICHLKWIERERSVADFYLFLEDDDDFGFRVYKPIIALG
jgi:hypothetical protein